MVIILELLIRFACCNELTRSVKWIQEIVCDTKASSQHNQLIIHPDLLHLTSLLLVMSTYT